MSLWREQPVLEFDCGGLIPRQYDARLYTGQQMIWLQAFEMECGYPPQVTLFEAGVQDFAALQRHNLRWLENHMKGMMQRLSAFAKSPKRRYEKRCSR